MPAKTISDSAAKNQCRKYLASIGFGNFHSAQGIACDLIGYKNDKRFFFEIKYSSKKEGGFFGCVMLSEMFHALSNEENYFFLVCRGDATNLTNWYYQLFTPRQFFQFCTLTTPICHYRFSVQVDGSIEKTAIGKRSVLVTEEMILDIWKKFKEWKPL